MLLLQQTTPVVATFIIVAAGVLWGSKLKISGAAQFLLEKCGIM